MAGINVLQEMASRKSSMASNLQPMLPGGGGMAPPQQSMAPPQQAGAAPQQAVGPPPEQLPGGVPQSLAELRQLHESQNASMEARGQDLRLAQMLMRALDPGMPKGFRQLGLKNISQTLGVDPKGDTAKDIINTMSSLDPESLEGIRRGIAESSTESPPGEITKMVKGTLTGQVPPDQLLQMASAATQQADFNTQTPEAEAPMMRLGGPPPHTITGAEDSAVTLAQAPGQVDAPGAALPPRTTGAPRMPFEAAPSSGLPRYREQEISPRMREMAPELADVLGLDVEQPYRNIDVMKGGWPRLPTDYEGQQRAATDTKGIQSGIVDTLQMSSQLASLVQGRPEALDLVSFRLNYQGFGIEGEMGINPSGTLVQMKDALRGIGRTLGIDISSDTIDRLARDDLTNTEAGRNATNKIVDWMVATGTNIQDTAEIRGRIKALLVPLAFAMAAAKGQTGRQLSDRDVAAQLEEIGRSQSPEVFVGALRDMTARVYDGYNNRMLAQFGGAVPIAHVITPEAREAIINSPVAPPRLVRELQGSAVPNVNQPQRPAQVSAEAPPAGEPNPGRFGSPAVTPATPIDSGPAKAEPQAGRRRLERISPTIEEEGAARVRLQEEDRAYVHEVRGQNRRRMEIAESSERRAQRQEVESRREKIRAAFAQIGASLSRSISGGGGGSIPSMGADQDPAAFRITPPPRRTPPSPVQASPTQQLRRRQSG